MVNKFKHNNIWTLITINLGIISEFDEIKKDDDVEPTILSEKPSKVIGLFRPRSQDARTFCNECNILFDTKQNYKSHRQKLHSTFQCNVCDKVFAENKILKRHLKIHNPNKPHVCNVCMMSFAESSNLTKHMKKHTGMSIDIRIRRFSRF